MYPRDDNPQDACRWLVLKRHERPPPGYFDRLPDRVLARIETQPPAATAGWVRSLLQRFELRPAIVGLLGVTLGGLYFFGLAFSNRLVPPPDRSVAVTPDPWSIPPRVVAWQPVPPASMARLAAASSVAPVLEPTQPWFLQPGRPFPHSDRVQRVGYSVWSR